MGNAKKILTTRVKEFFSLCKHYSLCYALYNALWWFCFYARPPFGYKISTYAIKKKTAWLDKYIEKEYKHIIDKYKGGATEKSTETPVTSPRIWVFWGQGKENMPTLVAACYKQLTKHNEGVTLITNENIKEYIDLPQTVLDKVNSGRISWAYFSDIVRNTLLANYGGLWLDATVWVPGKLPMDRLMEYSFFSPAEVLKADSRTIRFWSNFEWSWNGWCLWSNTKGHLIFSFVAKMLTEIAIKEHIIPDYVTIDYIMYYAIRNIPEKQADIEKAKDIKCNNRHCLATMMNEEYNEDRYKELTRNDYFFKLSSRACWQITTKEGKSTFYGKLIHNN